MVALSFNAAAVEPNAGFEPLPAGWYNVRIVASELKPTSDGTGKYISLQFEVLDGQYANRRVFTNLNIENKNPTAVNIAYADLSAICRVCGVVDLQDTVQLHGIPLQIKVTIKPADEARGYDAGNNVKGYRDQYGRDPKELGGTAAPAQPAPTQPIPAAPANTNVQVHTDAQGNVYHLINNEWVLQEPKPAAPPPPPAPAAPPPPPAAPAAPAAPPPPGAPAAPPAPGGAVTPPWGPPKA